MKIVIKRIRKPVNRKIKPPVPRHRQAPKGRGGADT